MTIEQIITLCISLAVILLGVLYLTLYHRRSQKVAKETITMDTQMLLEALGGKDNILNIILDHKRLKIQLIDPKLVSQASLKNLNISGFLSGKELKLLIKDNPIGVKNNLDKLRNEGRQ